MQNDGGEKHDLARLVELVAELRHWQKEFFRTRAPTALETARRLEKQVDARLGELGSRQGRLF